MTKPPTGCRVGYARVSTTEQNLDMQVEALLNAGVHKDHIYIEKVSGAAIKRPKLEWAFDSLRPGDTLVVWKMDRLARSLIDLLGKMKRLEEAGVEFVSLTEKIDTTTPGGRLIFHVLASIAEFERDLIRERTQAGVRAAMARGVKFGQDPILSPAQRKQAQKLRDKKVSLRLIAEQFDVSHSTIRAWTVGPGRTRTR